MNPVGTFMPLAAVFPNEPSTFDAFKSKLRELSLTDTLLWAARLNLIVSNPQNADHRGKQQYGINAFFSPEDTENINTFVAENGGVDRITIFFRGQLLEVFRWASLLCRDKPDDGTTFNDPQIRRTFAQVLLMASDLWAKRVFGSRFSLEGGLKTARRRGLGAIRGAIAETTAGGDLLLAIGRGKALFSDYFPKFYPEFSEEFYLRTGLTLENYYFCLSAIMTDFANCTPEKVSKEPKFSALFDVNKLSSTCSPEIQAIFSKYFLLESQTPDELHLGLWGHQDVTSVDERVQYEFKSLRQRPLLRTADGRAIILDPVFYSERATVGPLFLLSEGVSTQTANRIFGAFGEAFERYARDIFQKMYPSPSSLLVKRFIYDLRGRDLTGHEIQIADGCLNNVTDLILFEMKAVWIRDTAILDEDPERYLELLRDRYGIGKRGERSKGIAQLATAIANLASGAWVATGEDIEKAKTVYPVLLVHDTLLDTPVHSNFLSSEFKEVLNPDEIFQDASMRKGRFRILPLTVMTIQHLENFETSIEHFQLVDLLRDYTFSCPDRIVSLQNFIAASPKHRNKMYYSRSVTSKSLEVLKETQDRLFSNTS